MRRRASWVGLLLVLEASAPGCLGGVYSDPLRTGEDGVADRSSAPDSGSTDEAAEYPEAGPEPGSDARREAGREAGSEAGLEAGPDRRPDADVFVPTLSGRWKACGQLGAGSPRRLAVSANGLIAAILFTGGKIALHSLPRGELIREFQTSLPPPDGRADPDAYGEINDITLSPDGALVAIADGRHAAGWNLVDSLPVFDLPGRYTRVRLSPRGNQFLVWAEGADSFNEAELHAIPDGALVHSYSPSQTAAFSDEGNQVLTYYDGWIAAAAADAGGAGPEPIKLDTSYFLATFSQSGRYLVASSDPDIDVLLTSNGKRVAQTTGQANGLKFSDDETRVLVQEGGGLMIFDVGSNPNVRRFERPLIRDVVLGDGGRFLLLAEAAGLYAAREGAELTRFASLPGQGLPILSMAVSPDGRQLLVGSGAPSYYGSGPSAGPYLRSDVMLWDLWTQEPQRTFPGVRAGSIEFSAAGDRVLFANRAPIEGPRLEEWSLDAEAVEPELTLRPAEHVLWSAAYGPSPDQFVLNFVDGVAIASRAGTLLSPLLASDVGFPASALSPDRRLLAVSGMSVWLTSDLTKLWWDAPPVPLPPDLAGVDNWVTFSRDGRLLLVSDVRPEPPVPIKLYDTATGSLKKDLTTTLLRRPTFWPDGRWILAGDAVWNLDDGRIVSLYTEPPEVGISSFTPNGTIVVTRVDGIVDLFCPR